MSVSRLAALGAALLAGATLAACSSSGVPIAPTGNNNQVNSFPGAPVRFIQGSPNLNLGITLADFCVDGQFVVTLDYLQQTPGYILSLPAGTHAITLYQNSGAGSCTANPPLFTAANVTLAPNTKYAIVVGGDAGASFALGKPQILLFAVPHYNTPSGANSVSIYNASPRNLGYTFDDTETPAPDEAMDFWYTGINFTAGKQIVGPNPGTDPPFRSISVGQSVTNVLLATSTQNKYCFSAYLDGGSSQILTAQIPSNGVAVDPRSNSCTTPNNVTALSANTNIFMVDSSTAAQSVLLTNTDQNG